MTIKDNLTILITRKTHKYTNHRQVELLKLKLIIRTPSSINENFA